MLHLNLSPNRPKQGATLLAATETTDTNLPSPKRLHRWLAILLVAAPGTVTLAIYIGSLSLLGDHPNRAGFGLGIDFQSLWLGAILAANEGIAVLFDAEAFDLAARFILDFEGHLYNRSWSYPPHALLLVGPFGFLDYTIAYWLWMVLTGALLITVLRHVALPGLGYWLLMSPAAGVILLTGQMGFFIAALLIFALFNLEKRPVLAGVLIGLMTVKPQLGILIPLVLLIGGYWRVFGFAMITTAVLIVLSAVIFGTESWGLYLSQTLSLQTQFLESEAETIQRWVPSVFMMVRSFGGGLGLAYGLQAISAIATVGILVMIWRRCIDSDLRFAALATATVLTIPYFGHYDLLPLSLAAMILFFRTGRSPVLIVIAALAWTSPLLIDLNKWAMVDAPIAPVIFWALMIALWRETKKGRPDLGRPGDARTTS